MSTYEGYRHIPVLRYGEGGSVTQALRLDVLPALTDSQIHAIAVLCERVTELDGVRPLSEGTEELLMAPNPDRFRSILAWIDDVLVGFAALVNATLDDSTTIELAVDRVGRGVRAERILLDRALNECDGAIRIWTHGSESSMARLAQSRGFVAVRQVWLMKRTLGRDLEKFTVPANISIRPFDPATDTDDWLALNARAFLDLPDQGKLDRQDLAERLGADWFDPAGFLVAHDASDDDSVRPLLGFHWTKIHRPGSYTELPAASVGEVYVLGVDPTAHGRGVGSALTLAGLQYLWHQGIRDVILYVESSNVAGIATYEKLGFRQFSTDILYEFAPAR